MESTATLAQLLLSVKGSGGVDEADENHGDGSHVPSLQVQCLLCVTNADLTDDPSQREPEDVLAGTCAHLVSALQGVYEQKWRDASLVADAAGMDALHRALAARIPSLPSHRRCDIDGCDDILMPPDTSDQVQPSTIIKDVEDRFKSFETMARLLQLHLFGDEDGAKDMSVEELRNIPTEKGSFLDTALSLMMHRSFEDCLGAFSHPRKVESDVDELIDDYACGRDADNADRKIRRDIVQVCLFAGVARALKDLQHYREKKGNGSEDDAKENKERDSDGHLVYKEDEPEMYEGWYGSWPVNEDNPSTSKNSIYYGVKLGAILHYAEEQAKKMLKKTPLGSRYSLPRAKFHQDMSLYDDTAQPKPADEPTSSNDVIICRAKHDFIESDAFGGDRTSVYSSTMWAHDGAIGFSHTGAGWKNREFCGFLYRFDMGSQAAQIFTSREMSSEFWSTPSSIHADSTNNIVWVKADCRIKGFSTDSWGSDYIFTFAKNATKEAKPHCESPSKRQKFSVSGEEGDQHIIVFGSERIGYLQNGILQEWNLSEANRHDGVQRMVSMSNIDEDIAQWNADEIINLSQNTWMDENGEAEVTAGLRPDSIRSVSVSAPHSIGYLPNSQLAFAHASSSQVSVYNHDLFEVSRLVGFGTESIEIVQRPTFEELGDVNTVVASDKACVKIFDLRSGKAEIIINQRCVNSTPIGVGGAKFVCNKLWAGKGAMMWDLRTQKPWYSLPIAADTEIAWVPTSNRSCKPPILLTNTGECYTFGLDFQDNEWERKSAVQAWSELEKKDKTSDSAGDDCCIM